MRVEGEIADLVDREEAGSQVATEPMLECTSGLLPCEIEDQIGCGEKARRVSGEDGFLDQIPGDYRERSASRDRFQVAVTEACSRCIRASSQAHTERIWEAPLDIC